MTVNPVDVLKSWHLIEFFQPYKIEDAKNQVKISSLEHKKQQNALLPWLDSIAKQQLKISNASRYTLYLGVFELNFVQQICDLRLSNEADSVVSEEISERLDLEGISCIAKLSLDGFGVPDIESFSISTLPWALGCLKKDRLNELSSAGVQSKCKSIKEKLDLLLRHLVSSPYDDTKWVVDAAWIAQMIAELEEWAGIYLIHEHFFVLEWFEQGDQTKKQSKPIRFHQVESDQESIVTLDERDLKAISIQEYKKNLPQEEPKGEVDDSDLADREMPILNSFYLDDIEASMASFHKSHAGRALKQYLTITEEKTIDLYTEAGLTAIQKRVSVRNMPHGRWPSDPEHNMALMQQYAINSAIEELKMGGLLSVNGPPGTGKTTLLRDLIAHNVVERANVLSTFNTVSDSLSEDGLPVTSLAGFEMLVASSNNKAVENISRELPQVKSVADCFADLSYLKPIANQMNAKKVKDKYFPMTEKALCWGAISAVLGRKANRQDVKQRFFFDTVFPKDSIDESKRSSDKNFLNFWRWKALVTDKKESVDSFACAKEKFLSTRQKLGAVLERLATLEQLHAELSSGMLSEKINAQERELKKLNEAISSLVKEEYELKNMILMAQNSYELSVNEYEKHNLEKPNWLTRIFLRPKYKSYFSERNRLNEQKLLNQKKLLDSQNTLNLVLSDIEERKSASTSMSAELTKLKEKQSLQMQDYQALLNRFDGISLPQKNAKISDANLQRNAYWQVPEVNQLRSELFVHAMTLHEVWLYEASLGKKNSKGEAFRNQLYQLSNLMDSSRDIVDPEALWRLFFMIVPVASSTFASISRMLGGVSEEAFGWLMIDEAGQSIPQAAVGAIMRSKRVLVVGDPLQVEPVFTTPPVLVKALGERVLGNNAKDWSPQAISVQQVADRANQFGCYISMEDKDIWIGIPLWVHRRCIEPMFSVANKIAYNDRMIHGCDDDVIQPETASGVANSWIESVGVCSHRQYKKELGEDMFALLKKLLEAGNELNSIFVISPFKAVKNILLSDLSERVDEVLSLSNKAISKNDVSSWLRSCIGTVHTFQGKENDIVILVLGCDPNNNGGAVWASNTPNILNVAITRAKKHLFVVGDSSVWRPLPYFSDLYGALLMPLENKVVNQ